MTLEKAINDGVVWSGIQAGQARALCVEVGEDVPDVASLKLVSEGEPDVKIDGPIMHVKMTLKPSWHWVTLDFTVEAKDADEVSKIIEEVMEESWPSSK